jgi:hypothetical protein
MVSGGRYEPRHVATPVWVLVEPDKTGLDGSDEVAGGSVPPVGPNLVVAA